MGHIGSKARMLECQILDNHDCVHSGRYSFDLILMNLCQNVYHHKKRIDLKVGHIGSETRSLGLILEKSYVFSCWHSFESVCMKLCQNVWHHVMSDKIETGQVRSKSRSFDQIIEKLFSHPKGLKVLF